MTVVLRTCNVNLITNSNNFVKYSFKSVGCRLLGRCLKQWFTTTRSTVLTEQLKLKLINLMPRYLRLYVYVHGLVLFKPLKPELSPICYLLALLGAHHFLHVSRIRVKLLTFRLLMSYIYIYIWSTHS